ncbi:MAG TPA: 4'-phosphopantetheinyl transferase superfamily protein, partial [Pedobacter sp.]|uniref:4'-phosphopantetheinyl transferase superfamily protein n=1 Tax=Pedobacter sp. TaxID=1411316 RepID=UPI002CDAB13E
IKPVRFRELTARLYEEGARMFIQVGSGGLIGFIDDTLKGKNYSAVPSNVAIRSGVAQLQRVLAALFAEGKVAGMAFMGYSGSKAAVAKKGIKLELGLPLISNIKGLKDLAADQFRKEVPAYQNKALLQDVAHPVMRAFNDNVEEMLGIQSELLELFKNRPAGYAAQSPQGFVQGPPVVPVAAQVPVTVQPAHAARLRIPFTKVLDVTLQNSPYLVDHSLLRQPKGWHCVDDMDPVIPMTMIFEMFGEIAAEQSHAEHVHKIMNIKVFQWMNVAKPFRETVTGEWKSQQLAYLDLDRFANAEVLLSGKHSVAAERFYDTGLPLGIDRSPEQIYEEHMFHGPGYQGIKKLTAVGDKGITGIIEGGTGKGSLLDNAGQLFGLWLQLTLTKDRIAFPVKIQEIEFFGDMMDQQGSFECTCVLTELNEEFATADFVMMRDGKVWARINGWQNRRLEIDEALWRVSMSPLHNRLSEEIAPGVFMFHNAYSRVVSWDFILKRYFNKDEKQHHHSLLPNKRKEWIISRVAVKDAVRSLLNKEKREAYYPIEFEIRSDEFRKPYLQGKMTEGIHVSIAHKGTDAVGIARYDRSVGIDIERIEERNQGFQDLVFSDSEQALLKGRDHAEWATRFWVAKEAYGKYLGKGLQGNPRVYTISEIRGEELKVNDIYIKTIKHKNYIIGWTQ